jgi:hypothetical protein
VKQTYCGCGRRTMTTPCSYCRQGRAPPRPDVKTLPLQYLVECAHELARRRDEINEVLEQVGRAA